MAYTATIRRFHHKSHKLIEDLGLNLEHPEKLITWAFGAPEKPSPRPYGEVGGLLWPAKEGATEDENKRLKHMFLYNIQKCWVRSVAEYSDKIEIVFW